MAQEIMWRTKLAAVDAFQQRQREFSIFGIIIRIVHAYGRFFQCLLPDGSEVFRLVSYEKGDQTPPVTVAARIARALGVSIDWLFGLEEHIDRVKARSYGDVLELLLPLAEAFNSVQVEGKGLPWQEDKIFVDFFKLQNKYFALYRNGEIDTDMYTAWINKRIADLKELPFPQ